ncbi:lytic transglycosylase domain-containing protein [Jiella marina]|uniref:lytic transglycosylase domain-containing protein n=1 Tax=Jiella sp. LLJ827 TaxID=2917712 RepID=UPI002100B227|nr:lytic transglycosylase domain-containing protein [Jiella sp. LLJ827]MCQ0990570.1 lytic transglycosylase domain-containing protein [Jiella sp. LLJ827]
MRSSHFAKARFTGLLIATGLCIGLLRPAVAETPDVGASAAFAASHLPALPFPPSPPRFDGTENGSATPAKTGGVDEICRLIGENADAVGMPKAFFARLIWKESRFDAKAVSPVGARGIAQFMPYTAAERGLANPYDVEEAIRHSALYLSDLRTELGNWGLAAAAYNGGINRVKRWIARGGRLPYETENYVAAITARPALWFKADGREVEPRPLEQDVAFFEACRKLPVMKTRAIFASVESGIPKPWGVQVAGHRDQNVALRMFRRTQAAFPGLIGNEKPLVIRDRVPGGGTIYAIRIGTEERYQANRLCVRLRLAGGSCIVAKNR